MKAIRTMVFSAPQDFKKGDIIDNMRHWCADGGQYNDPDLESTYTYIFECSNLIGEIIDYDRIEEDTEYEKRMYDLGINADCFEEKEVYVDSSVKFKITEVEKIEDWTEEYGTETYIQKIIVEMI